MEVLQIVQRILLHKVCEPFVLSITIMASACALQHWLEGAAPAVPVAALAQPAIRQARQQHCAALCCAIWGDSGQDPGCHSH